MEREMPARTEVQLACRVLPCPRKEEQGNSQLSNSHCQIEVEGEKGWAQQLYLSMAKNQALPKSSVS